AGEGAVLSEAVEVVAGYRALVIWRLIAVKLSLFPPSGAALGGVGRGWRGGDGAVSVRAHTLARACPSRSSPPSLPPSLSLLLDLSVIVHLSLSVSLPCSFTAFLSLSV